MSSTHDFALVLAQIRAPGAGHEEVVVIGVDMSDGGHDGRVGRRQVPALARRPLLPDAAHCRVAGRVKRDPRRRAGSDNPGIVHESTYPTARDAVQC